MCKQKNADTCHIYVPGMYVYMHDHGVVFSMWGGLGFNLSADSRLVTGCIASHRAAPHRTAPWAALRIPVCARLLFLASALIASGLLASAFDVSVSASKILEICNTSVSCKCRGFRGIFVTHILSTPICFFSSMDQGDASTFGGESRTRRDLCARNGALMIALLLILRSKCTFQIARSKCF